jgi:hypothetical protein
VVALEALGQYAGAVFADAGTLQLAVAGGGLSETLTVSAANFNVLQRRDVAYSGAVNVQATGTGLALLQARSVAPCTVLNTHHESGEVAVP